jgi:hypothetical protein
LNMLQTDLSQLVNAMDVFMEPHGGIDFISRCSSLNLLEVDSKLRSIKSAFHSLKSMNRRLISWSEICATNCEMVSVSTLMDH